MVIFISIKILICLITFIFLINKKFIHLKQLKLINGIVCADQMCLETQVQDDDGYIFNVGIFFHYNHLEH